MEQVNRRSFLKAIAAVPVAAALAPLAAQPRWYWLEIDDDDPPLWMWPNNGVVMIDVKTHRVTGPLSDAELAAVPEIAGIKLLSVDEAWKIIPWKGPWCGA